ncbi:hypothetical protein ACFLQ1_01995 [Candidatus Auribacterota bacterium]
MKQFFQVVAILLVFMQLHTGYVWAGQIFLKNEATDQQQTIKIGYKLKFGKAHLTPEEKLNSETAGEDDFFDSFELGGVAFLIILMILLTTQRKGQQSKTGGGGSDSQEGEPFADSTIPPTSEEIQATAEVAESEIPSTNVPVENS